MKYNCRKSNLQGYDCQVCTKTFFSLMEYVCFDKCLVDELFNLWDLGIVTTGSCCNNHEGCNGKKSYIGVEEEFIPKMKVLGYKVRFNKMRPKDEDSFIPKTKFN